MSKQKPKYKNHRFKSPIWYIKLVRLSYSTSFICHRWSTAASICFIFLALVSICRQDSLSSFSRIFSCF